MTESDKDQEIAQLRERCALLDQLLSKALRHKYIDESACSPIWLAQAKETVTDLDKFKDVWPGGIPRSRDAGRGRSETV